MSGISRLISLCAAVLAILALPTLGQSTAPAATTGKESAKETDTKKTEKQPTLKQTIVVTATRSERMLNELPVSATVIDEEEIESAPAATVDDLIRTIPGVHMPLGSSLVNSVLQERFSMHGLGGDHALVLLDGIPMHDSYYGRVVWQKASLDSLERIEVIRGGNGSLFGNYATGGTVNLITRPVDSNEIRLDASRGSFDTNRGTLTIDRMIGDRFGARLSQHRIESDGYYNAVDPGPADVPVSNHSVITSLRGDFRPSAVTNGFVKLNWTTVDVSQGRQYSATDRDMFDFATSIHHAVGDRDLVSATLFRQNDDLRLLNTGTAGEASYVSSDSAITARGTGGSLEWTSQREGALAFLSLGLDFNEVDADEDRDSFNRTGTLTKTEMVTGRQEFAGLFGQVSWRPSSRVEVLTSARIDYFRNSKGEDAVVGGDVMKFPSSTKTEIDPRISVRYETGPGSALRAAVYRAFRAPTLRELYRNTQVRTSIILGNPYLKPETLVGGEIGFEHVFSRGRVEINLYRSDVDGNQFRAHVPGQPDNVFQNVNLGKSRSQGVEMSANAQFSRRWSLTAGYTFADSTVVSNPGDPSLEGKEIAEVPRHIGSLNLRYRGDDGLTVDLRGRAVGRSFGDAANRYPSPAHQVVDVHVSRRVTSWLDLYVKTDNIFDEKYYYTLTSGSTRACEPRNVMVGTRIHVPYGR